MARTRSGQLKAALLLLLAAACCATSANPLGRRALLQSDFFGSNSNARPAWFNNDRVQSGGNWGNSINSPAGGWGGRPQSWPGSSGQQWPGSTSGSSSNAAAQAAAAALAKNRKGDLNTLSALTAPVQSLRSVPRQTIAPPSSGPGSTLYQGLRRGGDARATAQSLANTFSSDSEAAATAVASAATDGGSSTAVAEAVAQTTVTHPNIAPGLLAKSADLAVSRGQTYAFANTMADAFTVAKRGSYVPQFTRSVADAIGRGGASTKLAYGEAIAKAIAQGGDSKAAVAEATATAFCEGGSTAQSWASAYAIALSKDSQGCLVLNEAKAMAQARCGAAGAQAFSKAEATSMVLGFCGLLDLIPDINYNFAGGNSGSSSWSP